MILTRGQFTTAAPWIIAAVALAAFGVYARQSGQRDAETKQATANLAVAVHVGDSLSVDLLAAQNALRITTARVDTVFRVRVVTIAHADTAHQRADSLIAIVPLDTGHVCTLIRAAYDARTTECERLRQANEQAAEIIAMQDVQLTRDSAVVRHATAQVDTLQARLHLVSIVQDCHILPFIPCPSRKLSFWGGLALGAAAMWRATR